METSEHFVSPSLVHVPLLCPDVVAVFLLMLASLCVHLGGEVLRRRRSDPSLGWLPILADLYLASPFRTVAAGIVALNWITLVIAWPFVPRYLVIGMPFLYFLLGVSLLASARFRFWGAGILGAAAVFNVANLEGKFLPSFESPLLKNLDYAYYLRERSHEYLAPHRSNLEAIRRLQASWPEGSVVTEEPYEHFLANPRLGYVEQPRRGYGFWMQSDNYPYFRHPDMDVLTTELPEHDFIYFGRYFPNVAYRTGEVEVLYEDKQRPPLRVFRRKRKEDGSRARTPFRTGQWSLTHAPGLEPKLVANAGEGRFRIEPPAGHKGAPYSIQLVRPGFTFEPGPPYRFSFRARAEKPRSLGVAATLPAPPWTNLGLLETLDVGPEWKMHRLSIRPPSDPSEAMLTFNVGESDSPVEVEAIELDRGFDPVLVATSAADESPALGLDLETRNGASATLSIDAASGVHRIEIEEATKGPPSNVQLLRGGYAVQEGERYTLAFRARAAEPRIVFAGVCEGFEPFDLGIFERIGLTTEWRSFRLDFRAKRSDPEARIRFDLASSTAAVELAEVRLIERDRVLEPRPPAHPGPKPFYNPMEGGPTDQARWRATGELASATRVTATPPSADAIDAARLAVEYLRPVHAEHWSVLLDSPPVAVREGRRHLLRFLVRAREPRTANVAVTANHPPWDNLGLVSEFEAGEYWAQRRFAFTPLRGDDNARIQFGLGKTDVPMWLADVRLSPSDFGVLESAGARSHLSLPDENDERARIFPEKLDGDSPFQIQLVRHGWKLEKGRRYELSFVARAQSPRPITVTVAQTHAPWSNLGLVFEEDLPGDAKAIARTFEASAGDEDAGVYFNVGAAMPGVEVSKIQLKAIPSEPAAATTRSSSTKETARESREAPKESPRRSSPAPPR